MTIGLEVRRANGGDAEALALVGGATFLESYGDMIPAADLLGHVRRGHSSEAYAAWLADEGTAIWIAETAVGCPFGYAVLTSPDLPPACTAPGDLELRRIYLLERGQGGGTGRRLMDAIVAGAAAMAATRVTVGVHGGNERAIGFYKRMGFLPIGRRTFTVGTQVYDDLVLARQV